MLAMSEQVQEQAHLEEVVDAVLLLRPTSFRAPFLKELYTPPRSKDPPVSTSLLLVDEP